MAGEFFAEHALYYLAAIELERLGELLEAWQHAVLCRAEPGLCLWAGETALPRA